MTAQQGPLMCGRRYRRTRALVRTLGPVVWAHTSGQVSGKPGQGPPSPDPQMGLPPISVEFLMSPIDDRD